MSAGIQTDRKSFHRRQMSALPTLLPGLDPDPPVLLCTNTAKYDDTILAVLRRHGWPGTSRVKSDAAPAALKSTVLARKIAKGSGLTVAEIALIAARVAWLMRNNHRWNARDGYAQLAPAKRKSTRQNASSRASAGHEKGSSSASIEPTPITTSTHDVPAQSDLLGAEKPVEKAADSLDRNTGLAEKPGAIESLGNGKDKPSQAGPRERLESDDEAGFGVGGQLARLEAAKRSLAQRTASAEAARETVSAVPNPARQAALTKPKCRSIKDIPSQKAKAFLFAILYGDPREKIERLGEALVADQTELTAALSGPDLGRQDIRNACAELGLELPC